ncbi:Rad52 Motif-Containing Protein 1 [Manis pentadactyla]|nr:Rad52 Motif-Containing Protein 1 [Manis pentadactyla]
MLTSPEPNSRHSNKLPEFSVYAGGDPSPSKDPRAICIGLHKSGKIAVEYRSCEEITDVRIAEDLQDLIQVSSFSYKQYGQGEEECLSDFSLEKEEFRLLGLEEHF